MYCTIPSLQGVNSYQLLPFICSRLLTDNYTSITKKHFLPSKGSSGFDPFSRGLHMTATSGFVKDIPVTVPRSRQVSILKLKMHLRIPKLQCKLPECTKQQFFPLSLIAIIPNNGKKRTKQNK